MVRRDRSRAFSLVELLVVIGIIAVLIALLMPAVSAVRERGNEVKCMAALRSVGNAAALHANDHRGYLPAAGWHWDLNGGVADPQGVGDSAARRYVYYQDGDVQRPVPITVALGTYLDAKVRLDSRDAMEQDMDGEPLRKLFRCPSQPEQLKGLTQKEDGPNWEAPREYSSFIFNEALLGRRDKDYETPVGLLTKVKNASVVMFAMDGRPRSETDDWLMVFDFGPDDTLADFNRQIQGTDLGKQSLDLLRHRGRANVLFVDGHVESVPMTEGGTNQVGVSRGIY